MSKKVYFTQEQLNHIIGEDVMTGGAYIDKTSTGSEYPTDSIPATDHEVIPTEPGGIPRPTGAYAHSKIPNNQFYRRGSYALYERNAELDGKNIYSLPSKVRKCATPDGKHDKIMKRIQSGEKMNLASLYRMRNELESSNNDIVKRAIDSTIKRAQQQGASLRNAHSNTDANIMAPTGQMPGKKHSKDTPNIHYDM